MSEPFVVVGGDAAGLSAASKFAREAPGREVVVFERGAWVSYAHCGMPYYVKGDVESLTDLTTLSPAEVEERGIDLRRHHEVRAVDPDAKTVTVRGPEGVVEQSYGDLLVATGARAATSVDGCDLDGAFTIHHMDAAAALRAYLAAPGSVDPETVGDGYTDADLVARYADRTPPETAAVVGGGYVGVEMTEALTAWGVDVHLFQRTDHVLPPFGPEAGEAVTEGLRDEGVTVHTETTVDRLLGDGSGWVEGVAFEDGRLDADLAVVGVGVEPNTGPVEDAGVDRGPGGAIRTDSFGRTNREELYAAGDCATARHAVTGEETWVPLGLTANRAGRAVGATVAGDPTPVGDVAGTAAVKAFDLEAARTGLLDPDRAREAGFDPVRETVTAGSRSGYYPGSAETTVTLVGDRESGRLLGGSIVGTDRAAVRIDTVATALEAGLTVAELERADLAYAPPFSPVWDPVLVAAKVLGGALD